MVKNQTNHQESGTCNLQKLTSNTGPLIPSKSIWFQLSREDLIIMPFIILILRFTLHSFYLNLTINMFHIKRLLLLNQLMIVKRAISWNSNINNTMKTFWVLTSRWFRLDWCWHFPEKKLKSILYCFITMEELMLQSQISFYTFLCLSQSRALWNWLIETRDKPK